MSRGRATLRRRRPGSGLLARDMLGCRVTHKVELAKREIKKEALVKHYSGQVKTVTKTADYTILRTDDHIDCNSTSAILISELASPVNGSKFTVTNVNTGAVTFDFDISGDSALSLGQYEGVTFRYNSTISEWIATEY